MHCAYESVLSRKANLKTSKIGENSANADSIKRIIFVDNFCASQINKKHNLCAQKYKSEMRDEIECQQTKLNASIDLERTTHKVNRIIKTIWILFRCNCSRRDNENVCEGGAR